MSERVLIFDPFAGAAGDMILGALTDLGVPLTEILDQLNTVDFSGYRITQSRVMRRGFSANRIRVDVDSEIELTHSHTNRSGDALAHDANHPHTHSHKSPGHVTWRRIREMIESSGLNAAVKERAVRVFQILADAEGVTHGKPPDEVHFHEVGAVDSLADVIGACVAVDYLKPAEIVCLPVAIGSGGTVLSEHGLIPIPSPATARILTGYPTRVYPVGKELCTPTGAALLVGLSDRFIDKPMALSVSATGVGAGTRDGAGELPGIFRAILAEADLSEGRRRTVGETVTEIVFHIDDMTGEQMGAMFEPLLSAGALDVFAQPGVMKKNRPAVAFTVLCHSRDLDSVSRAIFTHSTTFGFRFRNLDRVVLDRETLSVAWRDGTIRVKVGRLNGELMTVSPEYDDCRKIAASAGVTLIDVMADARRSALNILAEGS